MAPNVGVHESLKEGALDTTSSYKPEDIQDQYFGGQLKFRTKIAWPNVIFFLLMHLGAIYGTWIGIQLMWRLNFTYVYSYFVAFLGGEGTTIGAHRLWSHRAYKARRPLRIILIIMQTIAGENCCHKWVKDHRQHHKYSDTDGDPHNATRGLFFSHMGWLMMRKHPEAKAKAKTVHMADIERDPVVMFQKRHFKKMFFVFGVVVPVSIPMLLWGETFWNAFILCVITRLVMLWNVTWTVNSLAHFFGNKPYDKNIMSSENGFVSFLAYGEGWHNYHHTFPWDYKASEYGKHLNFTRDAIEYFERIGWAYDLKEASHDIVSKVMMKRGDKTKALSDHAHIQHQGASIQQQQLGY